MESTKPSWGFDVVALAIVVGTVIGFVDSSPGWDDTGVTAAALFVAAGTLAFLRPRSAWWIGAALGIPVLVWNAVLQQNFGSVIGIGIALAGAGIGRLLAGFARASAKD